MNFPLGLTNTITAVKNAQMAESPLLLIGGAAATLLKASHRYLMERAFAHGAMGRRIDPSWGGPIELFLVLASDPRLV